MKKKILLAISVFLIVFVVSILYFNLIKKNTEIIKTNLKETGFQNLDLLKSPKPYTVVTSEVEYFSGIKGFLAVPQGIQNPSAVITIHERRGLNNHIKEISRILAGYGYIVLSVDLYNGKVATVREDAQKYSQEVRSNPQGALENLLYAQKFLKEIVKAKKIASLGRCFGGGQSLNLALHGSGLDAMIMYYGTLQTGATLSALNIPMLGIFGETDTSIPVESVKNFQQELNKGGKSNKIVIYPGVGHAFANPTGTNRNQQQAIQAWQETITFLSVYLQ